MTPSNNYLNRLRLFNEKVNRINQVMSKEDFIERENNPPRLIYKRILLESLILNLRMLIQKHDPSSLKQVTESYSNLEIHSHFKNEFISVRNLINNYLDSIDNDIGFKTDLTRNEVLKTFINGDFAHADPKYTEQLRKWRENPEVYINYGKYFFITTLGLSMSLNFISSLNEAVLKTHGLNEDCIDVVNEVINNSKRMKRIENVFAGRIANLTKNF